ncbi:MAG: hypothetical protein VX278_20445 [Myxococcota bacterium]|nr:hypothetical protein [Myxococcota bacterium]
MRYWILLLGSACGTMNSARPLDQGQHAVGLTVGGPMIEFPRKSKSYIPLPNAVLEGRSGMAPIKGKNWDINYGINLTAIPFDQIGLHTGASFQLMKQNGNIPAVSVGNRLFLYSNHLSSTTIDDGKAFWACNEIVTTASWKVGHQMVYTGVSQYFDLSQPSATITPFLGAEFFNTGVKNGFVLQFEVRNYALGRNPTFDFLEWNTPFGSGAFGGNLGLTYRFGGAK